MASAVLNKDTGLYDLEAEEVVGSLVGTGFYHGVRDLRDRRSMLGIPRPDLFLLNCYRALTVGQTLGILRELEHEAQLEGDRLEIRMAPSDWHQVELQAVYRVVEPSIIDLTLRLKALIDYPYYQLYLSSYFARGNQPYVYVSRGVKYRGGREPGLVHLEECDFVRGYYTVFPRDQRAAAARYDGRFVDDAITGPYYAEPLAFMFNPQAESACAIMAGREACDSFTATYQPAEVWDGVSAHNAIYHTLVGRDLAAGEEWSATVRMQVFWIRHNFDVVLDGYREFLERG